MQAPPPLPQPGAQLAGPRQRPSSTPLHLPSPSTPLPFVLCVVFDRNDAAALERARAAFDDILRAALELGGTITGEHGVGALKRPFLGEQLGAGGLHLHHAIKGALDPLGILNPGKVF